MNHSQDGWLLKMISRTDPVIPRLGLSNLTIGNIYCITVSAVQHRKLKLKKDVFGETNPDVTLEQILNS